MSTTLWSSHDGTLQVVQDQENRFFEVRVCGSPAGLLVYEQRWFAGSVGADESHGRRQPEVVLRTGSACAEVCLDSEHAAAVFS